MKKQGFIQLHRLLGHVKEYYEDVENESIDVEEYTSLGVKPSSIHKSKTDQKDAMFTLLDEVSSEIEEPGETDVARESLYDNVLEKAEPRYRADEDFLDKT